MRRLVERSFRGCLEHPWYLVLGMVAPRVDAGVLLANHAVTPPGVLHVVAGRGNLDTFLFEINVSQALWQSRCQLQASRDSQLSVSPSPAMLVM